MITRRAGRPRMHRVMVASLSLAGLANAQDIGAPVPVSAAPAAVGTRTPAAGTPLIPMRVLMSRTNEITESADRWYQRIGQAKPWLAPHEPAPAALPLQHAGRRRTQVSRSRPTVATYEHPDSGFSVLALAADGRLRPPLDFTRYFRPARVAPGDSAYVDFRPGWVMVAGDTLFMSYGHSTYARSSFGENAFVMAVHQPTGRVLWRSPPLVSNTASMVALDDLLVVGYGFTAEPDLLYLLDRATGAVRGRLPVPDGPELIAREGQRRVRVRTYSRDMLIEIGARP